MFTCLQPHHAKPNTGSSNTRHDTHARHMRRRRVRSPDREPGRRPGLAVRALDRVAGDAAQALADARGARGRQRGAGVGADGGRPAITSRHDHRHGATAARAAEVLGARGVVGAALRDGARAGALVGEGGGDVGEAEVVVGHVADGRRGRGPEARGRGAGAHGARGAAGRGVVGVQRAGLAVGAADAVKGRALVRAAVCAGDAAVRLAGEELLDRVGGPEAACGGRGRLGWEEGLQLGEGCGAVGEEEGDGDEG